jgi:hypothetical protein
MSGSNSSAHNADHAASEPLSFTVHSVPQPGLGDERTRSGRLKMLLVLLVCAAPVIASYLTYFVIRPQGRTNYSTLILPTRAMPELGLRRMDGTPVASPSLKGQWLLIVVGPARCDAACDKRLFMQRQLREMLGKDRDRLDKLWLVTDGAQPSADLRAAAEAAPAMQILQADAKAVSAWLAPEPGHALEEHLYLVDPMGEWMMRMPAEPDPAKVKRDLEKLLRASAGWDKPGR